VSSVPRHDLDDYSSGGMRGRPGFDPDALHSARYRIQVNASLRARAIEHGREVRVRRAES
jgi:hypothetical protein